MYPPIEEESEVPVLPTPVEDQLEEAVVPEAPSITDEDIANALLDLLKSAREEDRWVRDEQLMVWKRLDYYWNNILDIFLDPVSRDWRVPDWDALAEDGETPPRLINIYRPHGEAIVAALSVSVPSIIFHPDDADNPDDVEAATAYRSITELMAMHNDAAMLIIRCIVIMFNQGTIFGYNYYHTDPKFGTYKKSKVEVKDISVFKAYCPECGEPLDGGISGKEEQVYQCESCGYQGPAEVSNDVEKIPQIVGYDESPKGTVCQDIFSGLNVKVPAYVRKQEECGYLLLEFTQSAAMLRSIFQDKADKIASKHEAEFEGFAKMPVQYLGEMPDNAATVSCIWVRPWQFWELGTKDVAKVKALIERYPSGCYAIFVNDEFMEANDENMDEHWTISENPLGNFIYAKPLGENLATVQDIRAQLVEIELQTAEYGIPETFADGRVLDFNKYGQGRARPGMVTQAKPQAGKSLQDAFYTTKTAVLSQEINPLRQSIDQDAQFVVGSFPSVYGGPATGGSKTASEYSQSRSIALQRLGTTWKIITNFWAKFQSRSAVEYAGVLKELGKDEKFTKRQGTSSFVNVWIRQQSLTGKVGRVEPEATETLPTSWAQKKEVIMTYLQSGVQEILTVLTHPENADLMKEISGLEDLYIPGEESRMRQRKEFQLLSQGIQVPINPMVDQEEIHVEVLRGILEGPIADGLSEEGRNASMEHLMMHMQSLAQKAASQAEAEANAENSGSAPGKEPQGDGNEKPV